MSGDATINKNKRKRKKTFLKNARKYAKKGYYGRGSHMDADTYQYFVRILEVFNQGFESDEDKGVFVDNVFEQTIDKEVECSCNQVGCRVIEMLLPFAGDAVLQRFMDKFGEDLRPLSKDRFASFVLQSLVTVASQKSFDPTKDHHTNYKTFTLKVSKFMLNNLEDYIWDNFGNRIIRTCLCALMQIPEESKKGPKKLTIIIDNSSDLPLIEEYVDIARLYGQRLILWPQFGELCSSELTSGFLQVLLKVLRKADSKLLKKYLEKLLEEIFLKDDTVDNKDKLPHGFMSTSLLMLMETALQVARKKTFQIYCNKLFTGRMLKLASLKGTSFVVQKVLTHCNNKEQFEQFFDELSDHFPVILEKSHPAVILSLCEACKRLSSKQGPFVQNMMKTLNCFEPEELQQNFTLAMCRLAPFDSKNPFSTANISKDKLSLQGTLMLQLMLEFNKPIKIVNSILSMEPNDLKNLFSNPMGSHIVDSYMKSSFVGEKSREKLIRKMKDFYGELATSKYGSRAFEAIWGAAPMKAKIHIMEELAYREGAWSNSECGRIIANKVNMALFRRDKESWKVNCGKEVKPEEVLADVLK